MKQLIIIILGLAFTSCGVHQMAHQLAQPSTTLADTIYTKIWFFSQLHYANGMLLSERDLQIKTANMPEANKLLHKSVNNFNTSLIFDAISLSVMPMMFREESYMAPAMIFGISEMIGIYLWVKSAEQKRKAIKMHNDYLVVP